MLKKLSQCIGLASLILVMNYGDLLGGGYDARMHVPFALNSIVYAQLVDIVLLGLLLFAVIGPLSRTRLYPWVRLLLAIIVPPYLIERMRVQIPFPITNRELFLLAIVWTAILLLLLLRSQVLYRRLMRVGDFVGIFFAVFSVCSVLQMLWILHWKPGPHERTAVWATTTQPPRDHPRLVWIIFDELSYDQVFDHRAHDLALPNFDALRNQSTIFSGAQPIGDKTVKVIPSLFTGHIINAYDFTFDNRFIIHDAGERGFHPMEESETVFGDAQKNGWRTAAVGWYNPYCTIYANAIDDCYWMNLDKFDGPMAQDAGFWRNTLSPLSQTGEEIIRPKRAQRDLCTYDVRQRYKTYIDLEQHTSQLLSTDQADFIFLHLPVPHSPNIWSRARGSYTQQCGSSYLDNLALTDRELGSIVKTLQSSPRWKDTTLIVEGDHSWRTYLWNNQPSWTSEDDAASRSGFDPRPAVIIHQAGQTQPQVNATPWSLLNIHSVVEQVVHGAAVHF
jgi:Sulfatase